MKMMKMMTKKMKKKMKKKMMKKKKMKMKMKMMKKIIKKEIFLREYYKRKKRINQNLKNLIQHKLLFQNKMFNKIQIKMSKKKKLIVMNIK